MPFKVAIYSENRIKLISTLCKQNVAFLNVML